MKKFLILFLFILGTFSVSGKGFSTILDTLSGKMDTIYQKNDVWLERVMVKYVLIYDANDENHKYWLIDTLPAERLTIIPKILIDTMDNFSTLQRVGKGEIIATEEYWKIIDFFSPKVLRIFWWYDESEKMFKPILISDLRHLSMVFFSMFFGIATVYLLILELFFQTKKRRWFYVLSLIAGFLLIVWILPGISNFTLLGSWIWWNIYNVVFSLFLLFLLFRKCKKSKGNCGYFRKIAKERKELSEEPLALDIEPE